MSSPTEPLAATIYAPNARRFAQRYEVRRSLGQGAMGEVVEAFDTVERKMVALKLLKPSGDRGLFLFKQEFREAVSLRHPHLAEVYDFGIDSSGPFFTMELVDGPVLETGEPYGYREVCDIIAQILLAVDFIHSRGKLHRDLKPENVRYTSDAQIKVLDLGLLQPIGGQQVGQLTGTLSYMPPEAIAGKPLLVSADLYSIGVIAYELLTGAPPFASDRASELLAAIRHQVPEPLDRKVPALPPDLAGLFMGLIAKDAAERPQRAGDVLRVLSPYLSEHRLSETTLQAYSYLLPPGLVGRKAEMSALMQGSAALGRGHGYGVMIGADPGVGKSRLIDEFRMRCQLDNLSFVATKCTYEGGGAYSAFRQLIKAVVPLASERTLKRYEALLRFLLPSHESQGAESLDIAVISGMIATMISEVAHSTPLVLYIDDLQWADALSLKVFSYCIDAHRREPVLWLGAYRSEEVTPLHPVVQAISEGTVVGLRLSPFAETEIAELVSGMLGTKEPPAGILDLLTKTTLGNGFFIIEMMRYLVDRGYLRSQDGTWTLRLPDDQVGIPHSIETLVVGRVERLSPEAQRLARIGAVLAEDIWPHVIDSLAELPEQALLDAINELIEHQVWQVHEGAYRFVHDRIREGLYQDLSATERERMHRGIALRLQALNAPSASLAYHFLNGGELKAAVQCMRKAGLEAEAIGAFQEAYRHWKHGSEILEAHPEWGLDALQLEFWLDLGMKCGFSVDSEAGEVALAKALKRLEPIGNPVEAAKWMSVSIELIKCLPKPLSKPILDALSRPVPFNASKALAARIPNYMSLVPLLIEANTWFAVCSNSNGKIRQAIEASEKAQRLVPDKSSWAWGVVIAAYAYSRVIEGKWDESIRTARHSFELVKDEMHPNAISMACGSLVLGNNQVYCGEPINWELTEELRVRSERANLTEWRGMVQYAPMVHYALTGRSQEAIAAIAEAEPYSKRCGRGTVLEYEIFLAKARVHTLLGEFEQALDVIDQGIRLNDIVPLPYFTARFYEIRGRVYLERGELEAAQRDFLELIHKEQGYGIKFSLPEGYLGLSEVARRRSQLSEAWEYLAEARSIIDDPDFRCEIKRIYLDRQAGRLLRSEGKLAEARRAFDRSIALAISQDNPWQRALTLLDLGHLLCDLGEDDAAKAEWLEAKRLFQETANPYGLAHVSRLLSEPEAPGSLSIPTRASDLEQLAILTRFSAEVTRARRTEEVLETILLHAMDAVGGERGAIVKVFHDGTEVAVSRENGRTTWGKGPAISRSLLRRALESEQAVLISDVLDDDQLSTKRSIMVQSIRSMICVPLEHEPETLVLYADRQAALEGGFDQAHAHLLQSLVQFGRIALNNARMIGEANERNERLQILNEISLLVSSSLDLDQILQQLLDQVLKLTGAEVSAVLSAAVEGYDTLGLRGESAEEFSFSRSAIDKVVETRAPLCVLDTENSSVALSMSVHSLGLKSIMCVPLMVQEDLLGVLYVSSRLSVRTFTERDLDLLRAIGAHAALAIHNARQYLQIQEKRSMEAELAIAHKIQQGFFPDHVPQLSGLEVTGSCMAAREVGGDFYDVVPLADGRVALAIGDVSGKSVSAALYMAVVRTALRIALGYGRTAKQCLVEVNSQVYADIKDGSFITCFLGIYDPTTRTFAYAAAGHNLGLLLAKDSVKMLGGRGVPLGMDPDVFGAILESNEVTLAPGDKLISFTDGVIEALSPERVEFGEDRLLEALTTLAPASAQETLDGVLSAIQQHIADAPPWDDLTLLVSRVRA